MTSILKSGSIEYMTVKRVNIQPRIKIINFTDGNLVELCGVTNKNNLDTNNSPVVNKGIKVFFEKVLQFVSVGGDFV